MGEYRVLGTQLNGCHVYTYKDDHVNVRAAFQAVLELIDVTENICQIER